MNHDLPNWMERLLGIEAGTGQGVVWSLDSSWGWAPWVTLLGVVFAVAWVAYFTAREGASVSRPMKVVLVALRAATIMLLLFMIAEFMITLQRTGLPYVVVVLDESASMGIADRYSDEKLRAALQKRLDNLGLEQLTRINLAKMLLLENNSAALARIEKDYKLKVYFLAGAARAQNGDVSELTGRIKDLQPTGETSRLGAGVRDVLGDLRGTPPAAIILFTDGVTTEGETLGEVATYARRKGVPLLTVGLGSEEPIRDIELSDLLIDEIVFVDDVVNIQCTLTATGYEGRRVEVTLKEKDGTNVLARTTVTLGPNGQPQKVRLPYRPPKVGKFEYVVQVAQDPDEAQTDNNSARRVVDVRKEQIRVLYVQAYPNFEFRYLERMLKRDSTVQLKTVLQEADLDYAQTDPSALRVFPVRREELFQYDVILFGDVNPAYLSASVMGNLRDFVEQKGGGIVFLSGPRYTPMAYRDTPLAGLFPVDLNTVLVPPPEEIQTEGFQARVTDLGYASPHMQLGDTPSETMQLWRNLPPLYWIIEAPDVKPAARVLAVHPQRVTQEGRPLPLFCLQYVGAGKVLFHATDETWRWRYRIGDVLFARYWVQSIRYLARSKLLGGDRGAELTVDRREYRRGEAVRVRVRFADDRLAPAADDGVSVVVEQQGRKSRRMKLRRSASARGIFEGVLTGASQGKNHVWMATPSLEGRPPSADFLVVAPPGEFAQVETDVAGLARAAEQSRGKFYKIETADRLLNELPEGRQIPVETLPPQVLWNRWWVLSAFLGLLVGEWVLRKRKGLQ